MAKKYKPFPTSSHLAAWTALNCGTCKKGYVHIRAEFRCDWEREIYTASLMNSEINEETAKAIGLLDSEGCDLWECPGWERGRK